MTPNPLKNLRSFLSDYCHFATPEIVRPLSLWIAATHIFETFDCFPYLAITARTKRAGKTRLAELISFTCSMPLMSVPNAAALRRAIKDMKPTLISDEAEKLSSESASVMRQLLNIGYRKGQTMMVADGKRGYIQWPTFCPKVFVLIGNVYDTLRDRSIEITMERAPEGTVLKDFMYETAKAQGLEIVDELQVFLAANLEKITAAYMSIGNVKFLTDRDAEIWRPLFALAAALEPESVNELHRIAVDLSTEKLSTAFTISKEEQADREKIVENESYARRAVSDLLSITVGIETIQTSVAVELLKNIDIAPWRKYQGTGLEGRMLADLVSILELKSKPIRVKAKSLKRTGSEPKYNGTGQNVSRGFTRADILACAKKYNIKVSQ